MKRKVIWLIVLLTGLLPNSVWTQEGSSLRQNQVPLEQLLNNDGSLPLERGISGNTLLQGFRTLLNSNGAPKVFHGTSISSPTHGSQWESSLLSKLYQQSETNPDDKYWDDRFAIPGSSSSINTIVYDRLGNIYVGGHFQCIGSSVVNYIAKWDGTSWSALGGGLNEPVYAIAIANDGSLYAGGSFSKAGDVAASCIARWDGNSWSALGSGVDRSIYTLAFANDGTLYVGGEFANAGGIAANRIAKWDGSSWSALGQGMDDQVRALAVAEDGTLYAGGAFTEAGRVPANRIAKWDGKAWSNCGSLLYSCIYALLISENGVLNAGGDFVFANGARVNGIAKWDGTSWSALGDGVNGGIVALAEDDNKKLYVGGWFDIAGGIATNNIAIWDGSSWAAFGAGINKQMVASLAIANDGTLYAGGDFTRAGDVAANYIAKWDGSSWSALGTGISGGFDDGTGFLIRGRVDALAVTNEGTLYAGGAFSIAGGVAAYCIARWDGTTWSALGTGTEMTGPVLALAIDNDGTLYAGGGFSMAGGVAANYIAKWDGTTWSALGGGMNGPVYAIAIANDGILYAGGSFSKAGDVAANYIAKWDGSSWSALGTGISGGFDDGTGGQVDALAVTNDGTLYAGGFFTTAGEVSANHIAKWDGAFWSALGDGISNMNNNSRHVSALAVADDGTLYAGGYFTMAGEVSASHIAKWDGSSWSALGDGMDNQVRALAISDDGTLHVGGYFTTAGKKVSNHFGIWSKGKTSSTVLLSAKIYLEGAYSDVTNEMSVNMRNNIPLRVPYPEDERTVTSIPNNITDWILVQIKRELNGPVIASRSAFLRQDGHVVSDDSMNETINLPAVEDEYYVLIKHRNHLPVISSSKLLLKKDNSVLYDFTLSQSTAYGSNALKQINSELDVWGMWTGDINQDNLITTRDYYRWYRSRISSESGYIDADLNLDGGVDESDYNLWKNNAILGIGSVTP